MILDHRFGKTIARYAVSDDKAHCSLTLLPVGTEDKIAYEKDGVTKTEAGLCESSLAHLQLSHHNTSKYSNCYKLSDSLACLRYAGQTVQKDGDTTTVITTLEADEGYRVEHRLSYTEGDAGFAVQTVFTNTSDKTLTLE